MTPTRTPQEKAKELCNTFIKTYKTYLGPPFRTARDEAKENALFCVEEIMKVTTHENQEFGNDRFSENYWKVVKREIEKLWQTKNNKRQ